MEHGRHQRPVQHQLQRQAFGAPLADKQALRHRLVQAHADTRGNRKAALEQQKIAIRKESRIGDLELVARTHAKFTGKGSADDGCVDIAVIVETLLGDCHQGTGDLAAGGCHDEGLEAAIAVQDVEIEGKHERRGGQGLAKVRQRPVADDAMSLLDYLGPLADELRELVTADLRVVARTTTTHRCNWKIMAEGFLEVYHARTIHPTTVAPTLDTRGTVISLFDHGHQNMLSPVKQGTRNDARELLGTLEHLPPLMREHIQPAHGIFPNIISPLDARGFPFLVFWPEAIDRTRLDIVWFAADWGEGELPHPEIWQQRFTRFDTLMEEDYRNLGPIQRSMECAAHGGQVVNYQERRIWHVHAWIDKTIGPERVPPALRTPDLLDGWVDLR